jgi:hypothetical protein
MVNPEEVYSLGFVVAAGGLREGLIGMFESTHDTTKVYCMLREI